MKDGLLERIRSNGHWRVVLRPLFPMKERLSFQQCAAEVERARVSIRGWDYPHISRRQDEQGGEERGADYHENWCDWHTQVEFWRMYRSAQFLSYNALDDDLEDNPGRQGGGRYLNVIGAIYAITEFAEFAHRLAIGGLYSEGLSLVVALKNTRGRFLQAGRGRMPFLNARRTQAETISIERRVDSSMIADGAIPISLSILLELFDNFGWNPDANQIRADQEAFYRREWR